MDLMELSNFNSVPIALLALDVMNYVIELGKI